MLHRRGTGFIWKNNIKTYSTQPHEQKRTHFFQHIPQTPDPRPKKSMAIGLLCTFLAKVVKGTSWYEASSYYNPAVNAWPSTLFPALPHSHCNAYDSDDMQFPLFTWDRTYVYMYINMAAEYISQPLQQFIVMSKNIAYCLIQFHWIVAFNLKQLHSLQKKTHNYDNRNQ